MPYQLLADAALVVHFGVVLFVAGAFQRSVIEHWMQRLIYFEAPLWVFWAADTQSSGIEKFYLANLRGRLP